MTPEQALRFGFLVKLASEGYSPETSLQMLESCTKQAWLQMAAPVAGLAIGAGLGSMFSAGPRLAGSLGSSLGDALGKPAAEEATIEELQKAEVAETLRRSVNQLRRSRKLRGKQTQPSMRPRI